MLLTNIRLLYFLSIIVPIKETELTEKSKKHALCSNPVDSGIAWAS